MAMTDPVFGPGQNIPGTGGINPDPAPTPWLPTGKLTDEQKVAAASALAGLLSQLTAKEDVVKKTPIAYLYEDGTWEKA